MAHLTCSKAPRAALVALLCTSLLVASCATPSTGDDTQVRAARKPLVEAFATGSLIIPMGTDYQDRGTLRAFGLVYALLRAGVTVKWTILTGKTTPFPPPAATDFQVLAPATVTNRESGAAVATPVSYRGGSFVVDGSQRATALPIIDAWLASDNRTVVHDVTGTFSADVARTLTAAPRIGVFADGNEDIAFTDLNAAGITDSANAAWSNTSVDLLTDVQLVGPTTTSSSDGALFRADGSPAYCHVTSMHWKPTTATRIARIPGIVSEVRAWLDASRSTHAFMQCHAIETFENDANGRFLTTTGVLDAEPAAGTPLVMSFVDSPFNQLDGALTADNGSIRTIAPIAAFRPFTRTLIAGPTGVLWATARLNGDANNGQLTYLGGHSYDTAVPVSSNPQTNGVRLFLNSLFESDCASPVGAPAISVVASAPATSTTTTLTFTLTYTNSGGGFADTAILRNPLPTGATFVSASSSGSLVGSNVTWNLGNLAPGAMGTVTFTVTVPGAGSYMNSATMSFLSALTPRTATSNTTTTVVSLTPPDTVIATAEPSPTNDPTGDFTFTASIPGSTFECSVDGGAFAACSATFSTVALADGMHTLAVRATSGTLTDPTPATATWIVDTTPPDTSIPTAEPSPTNDPTGDFVFASPDATATFQCSVDGAAFAACPATFSTAALASGMHTISARAVDAAGNVDPTPATAMWTVDLVEPDTSIATSEPSPTTDPTGDFSFVSPDATATFQCSVDGAAFVACPATFSTAPLADGPHTLSVRAVDPAGNVDATPASAMWVVDTTPPDTLIVTREPDPTSDATGDFTFSSPDATATFACSVDGGAFAACSAVFSTVALADGMHTLAVRAIDAAGNVDPTPAMATWVVDRTAPDTVIVTREPSPTNDPTGDFTFSSADATATFECSVDGGSFVPCPATFSTAPLADGSHTLSVRAVDAVGNVDATPATATWTLDTHLPDTTIVTREPSPTNDPTGDFTFSSPDAGATFECSVDGATFAACPATFSTAALADGPHTLSVRAVSTTGNVDPSPETASWTVDTSAPDTTIVTAEPSPTNDRTGDFSFSSPDATATFECSVDGSAFTACPATFSTASLADGPHTLSVRAVDAAGNVDATPATASWTVTTSTSVAITTPANGSTTMNPTPAITGTGAPGATVAVTIDGASAGTATVSAGGTWSLTPSTALANGMHTAVATATDLAGNTATDTTTFTVMAGTFVNILVPAEGAHVADTTPTISGTGEAGSSVAVTVDGTSVGTATVASDGTWSLTPASALAAGSHTVVATATDTTGDMATDTSTFVVDSGTFVDFLQPGDQGPIGDATPELSGTAEPGDSVAVTVDGMLVGTVTADAEGNWTLQLNAPLAAGAHAVSVLATDDAANTATDTGTFTLDLLLPALEIRAPGDHTHTNDTTPAITGDTEPGLLVIVAIDGGLVGTALADEHGHWTLVLTTPLGLGAHDVFATVTDPEGHTADDAHDFIVDGAAPSIDHTAPADGSTTADTRPTIRGTATPLSRVQVFVDGRLVDTVTTAGDGTWSVPTLTTLTDGTHTVRAVATDASGDTATDSGSFVVDTATVVAITRPANGSTTSVRPILAGTAEPGDTVVVSLDGTVLGTVTAGADGTWTLPTTADLTAASHTVSAHATDEAGNTADASSTFTVEASVLDTDRDGIADPDECPSMPCRDSDSDGTPDFQDPDDDGDSVPTVVECRAGLPCSNSDSDGSVDYLDPDDDNDGVPTSVEAPAGVPRDTDHDDLPDHLDPDDDGDGIRTMVECPMPTACVDSDTDGRPDFIDPDDDDDGISTAREVADGMTYGNDVNRDGHPNWLDRDADGDTLPDHDEGLADDDDDGIPDYLDPRGGPMPDAGVADAGAGDAGVADAGPGATDAGRSDAGSVVADGGGRTDAGADAGAPSEAGVGPHAPGGLSGGACNCSVPGGAQSSSGARGALALLALGFALVVARRRRRRHATAANAKRLGIVALVAVGGAATTTSIASAQAFTLDQFRAAETANDGFALSRPNDLGHMRFGAQLVLDYAHDPLVYEDVAGDKNTQSQRLVGHQLVGTLGVAFGLVRRVTLFAGLPVSLWSDGSAGPGFTPADGTAISDPYLGVRVRLLGDSHDTFALGLQLTGTLPLARAAQESQAFSGEHGVAFLPRVMAELRLAQQRLKLGANLGARVRGTAGLADLEVGSELTFGVGASFAAVPQKVDVLLELFGATGVDAFFARNTTPLELLGGARIHPSCDLTLGAGIGGGLTRGYGSPNFRGVLSVGFAYDAACETPVAEVAPTVEVTDRDHDGILDDADRCPSDPEDVDTFEDDDGCPDPDNDGDHVLDVNDGAPLVPEDMDGFEDTDGVPEPDNDHDNVLDVDDRCPLEPEDVDAFQDEDGCPDNDNDGDTVLDAEDQCPITPGTVAAHGCSEAVRVDIESGVIFILQRVEFATNRDVILDRSFPLLLEVAGVLRANPQLTGIRIEGHTDDRGRDAANLDLSRRRANSVRRWLVAHEIDAARLEAWGCGEVVPLETNATSAGRQANRRVEFHIIRPAPSTGVRQVAGCVQAE